MLFTYLKSYLVILNTEGFLFYFNSKMFNIKDIIWSLKKEVFENIYLRLSHIQHNSLVMQQRKNDTMREVLGEKCV